MCESIDQDIMKHEAGRQYDSEHERQECEREAIFEKNSDDLEIAQDVIAKVLIEAGDDNIDIIDELIQKLEMSVFVKRK